MKADHHPQSLLINSIYLATEGEGVHIGTPQIFIRLQGCHIGCVNCDSQDTWDFSEEKRVALDKIVDSVEEISRSTQIKRVSLTGGDPNSPRHREALLDLVRLLKKKDYFLNIEASGTLVDNDLFKEIDFISFDFKMPSSGVRTSLKNLLKLSQKFPKKFQVKSVVQTKKDFEFLEESYKEFLQMNHSLIDFPWVITPAYNVNEAFPLERFQKIIEWNMSSGGRFRVIGQQHKWLFGPDRKNV